MDETGGVAVKPTVLVVQHQPDDLQFLSTLLQPLYDVQQAASGAEAVAWLLAHEAPDLILLDLGIKDPAGLDVCRGLKADALTREVPVILLADKKAGDEAAGFEAGAADFIRRPFSAPVVLARVKAYLALKTSQDFLRDRDGFLEREYRKRALATDSVQDAAIFAMAAMCEARESDTGKHVLRIKHFAQALAKRLQRHPRFADTLTERYINVLVKASPLCDLGEVSVPDRILLKPGPLTADEFAIMRTHPAKGLEAINHVEAALGADNDFLGIAKDIAYAHHEKWDGSGYPQGLMGEQIPLAARIMALADVYDALTSDRVYKAGVPHDKAVQVIFQGRGSHFDPDIADAFMDVQQEFEAIAQRHADTEEDMQRKMEYLANAIAEEVQI
jgi:putative two-component system response regulator